MRASISTVHGPQVTGTDGMNDVDCASETNQSLGKMWVFILSSHEVQCPRKYHWVEGNLILGKEFVSLRDIFGLKVRFSKHGREANR
jgi:hypothetical protein